MKDAIINVFKRVFDSDVINSETSQQNMGKWDSINHLRLIVELEEEFNISFDPEEIIVMKSINSIENIVKEKIDHLKSHNNSRD